MTLSSERGHCVGYGRRVDAMPTAAAAHGRRRRVLQLAWYLLMLDFFLAVSAQASTAYQTAPPVFGAYPTGGPVLGGTTVTVVGKEFGRINSVGLNRVRCSWGDPRPWQQSVFAAQQAEMDGWSVEESVLPSVPATYFTSATRLTSDVTVTPALRGIFGVPDGLTKVDLLECPSHSREAGDVSLWFSLRFYTTVRPRTAPATTAAVTTERARAHAHAHAHHASRPVGNCSAMEARWKKSRAAGWWWL